MYRQFWASFHVNDHRKIPGAHELGRSANLTWLFSSNRNCSNFCVPISTSESHRKSMCTFNFNPRINSMLSCVDPVFDPSRHDDAPRQTTSNTSSVRSLHPSYISNSNLQTNHRLLHPSSRPSTVEQHPIKRRRRKCREETYLQGRGLY